MDNSRADGRYEFHFRLNNAVIALLNRIEATFKLFRTKHHHDGKRGRYLEIPRKEQGKIVRKRERKNARSKTVIISFDD